VRSWPLLAAVALLILIGRRVETGDRLLALAAGLLAAYLLVPILSVAGPRWLVDTTLARVTAALAPLLAAGIGVRIRR
jgi:peptidoglycan/LPS O-acetylase OafA/YrhL